MNFRNVFQQILAKLFVIPFPRYVDDLIGGCSTQAVADLVRKQLEDVHGFNFGQWGNWGRDFPFLLLPPDLSCCGAP